MPNRVEVSFNPHGASEEWPHFLACAGDPEDMDFLYELEENGWRCTMRTGGPRGFETADIPIQNPDLEEKLWAGAEHLTEESDAEAFSLAEGSNIWKPFKAVTPSA